MKQSKHIAIGILIALFVLAISVGASAQEPEKPVVDASISAAKEAKIDVLLGLSAEEVVQGLKDPDFLFDKEALYRAIFAALSGKEQEAITLALNKISSLDLNLRDVVQLQKEKDTLYVCKKILEVFADQAAERIVYIYANSTAEAKGNIIQAMGNVAGGEVIRDLLITALNDQHLCGEEYPEMEGMPMRICDKAYNQLVLRYQVQDVLRTLGLFHKIEMRDYHIAVLKNKLKF